MATPIKMIQVDINEAEGPVLDWLVYSISDTPYICDNPVDRPQNYTFRPSSDWATGGQIIEDNGINVGKAEVDANGNAIKWAASSSALFQGGKMCFGRTPLEAAMRFLVADRFKDQPVMVPAILVQQSTMLRLKELRETLDEAHASLIENDGDGSFLPDFREWLDTASADPYHAFNQQAKEYLALEGEASETVQLKKRRP